MRCLSALAVLPLLLATCFSGESTRGLPCTRDESCGAGLLCVEGTCGGEPTQTFLSGLSVLFVMTDDPESGQLQARVAAAADPFLKILEDADLDFRVGVISTAMAHPLCGPGQDGRLLLTSCLDRPEDFKNSELGLDVYTDACDMRCGDGVQGEAAVPIETDVDEGPSRSRPWIQSGPLYEKNLYFNDLPPSGLIGCFLPQGVVGCRYEQPLAALLRALERMRDPMDINYGFIDEGSLLVVIFVGRNNECSHAADAAEIFDPEGAQTFWPVMPDPDDPDADPVPVTDPTPAICWNAGAACSNLQAGQYFECHTVDHAASGAPTNNASDAVLLPVATTAEAIDKIVTDLGAQLLISGILGVPPEGETLTYTTPMPDKPDPFGIGPGCQDSDVEAAPPLRLLAFAEAIDAAGPFFPACSPAFGPGLSALAKQLVMRVQMPLPD